MAISDNTKLHIKVERLITALEDTNKNIERISGTIYGDGNGEQGHVVRMDRLEQRAKRADRFSWTALTAGLVAIIKTFWNQIT